VGAASTAYYRANEQRLLTEQLGALRRHGYLIVAVGEKRVAERVANTNEERRTKNGTAEQREFSSFFVLRSSFRPRFSAAC
jgi:hypothetical protein